MSESPWPMVLEFHEVFELEHPDRPTYVPAELASARQRILVNGKVQKGPNFRPPDLSALFPGAAAAGIDSD